jgi:hypothetical protein
MARDYEAVRPPRFEIEQGLSGERIRIKARRNIFALAFLPFWLIGWTFGGVMAITEFARTGESFLAFWLCGWAVGWLSAILVLAWMAAGAEVIAVTAGDLEIGHCLFGLSRVRRYRGSEIRNLSAAESSYFARFQFQIPFIMRARSGAVKFSYGGRTIYAAEGLDEAEGRLIVERLARKLPDRAAH